MDAVFEWVSAVLGVSGVGGAGYMLLTARAQNRKTNSESTVLLIDSASQYAAGLAQRVETISREFDEYRASQARKWEQTERERRMHERQQMTLFRAHTRWDDDVADTLRDLGRDVPPPPPLYVEPVITGEATP